MRKAFRRRRERGQGMTEYIIIVAMIAVASILVVTLFGDNIRAMFGASANALAGDMQTPETETTGDRGIELKKSIKDFSEGP